MTTAERRSYSGFVGLLGGLSLFAYVLVKEWFVAMHGHVPRLVDPKVGIVWHLLENVPIVLIAIGLYSWYRHQRKTERPLVRYAYAVAFLGIATLFLSHFAEHLLPPVRHELTGGINAFVWSYYAGWLILGVGLTGIGVATTDGRVLSPTQRRLTVLVLPASAIAALLLSTTLLWSVSDGFKIPEIIVLTMFGYNLWHYQRRGDLEDDARPDAEPGR